MKVLIAIVLTMCGICLFAEHEEGVNLLPGNDFKLTADNLKPEGWTGNFGKGASIQKDSSGNFLRLENEDPDESVSAGIQAPIRLSPDMERIVVKGRVNVPKVTPGKENWHDARIALTFKRADGTVSRYDAIAWSSPTDGWVDFKKECPLPADAVEVGFSPAIFKAKAELELRNLRFYVVKEIKDQASWSLDDAWRLNTGTRERICLNGVWNIRLMSRACINESGNGRGFIRQPDLAGTLAGASSWTQIRVPGQWYSNDWMHYTRDESLLYTKGNRGPETGVCGQVKIDGKPIKELCCAWYEREFKLPENWSASNSFLKFDGFDFEGWIYLNNSLIAYQEGDVSREIPLPAGLRPGDTVKLNVLVCAEAGGMEQIVMGGGESYLITRKKESLSRGITGNVWLLRQPDVRAEDIRISSSTRENLLKVRFQLQGREALKGGRIELEVSNWNDSKPVKLFKADVEKASALPDSELEFSFPWPDAHRWNTDDPFLYSAKLRLYRADGSVADESEPLRFGFREIWIDGRDYYLNGAPLHFFRFIAYSVPKDTALRLFRYYRELGYNSVHIFPVLQTGPLLEAADETGMLVMLQLPSVNEYNKIWEKGGCRKWQSKTMTVMRESWNNPSVVSWEMNFNILGYAFDMFPELIGIETKRTFGPVADIIRESEKMVTAKDSSRPLLHHACGSMGPVHSSNIYLNFVQPQEKYEWLLDFKNKAVKPFFAVELGMPFIYSYYYGRLGFGAVTATEPLLAEYAAMYMGEKAFPSTASLLSKIANAKVERGASNGADKYSPQINIDNEEVYIRMQSELTEFIKYWRASGAGGLHPWAPSFWRERKTSGIPASYASLKTPGIKTLFSYEPQFSSPNALHERYKAILSPLLGFIGGPAAVFTERRRNYRAGDNISKSIVLINDSAKDYYGEIQVKLLSADAEILEDKTIAVSVPKGRTRMFDFSFAAPDCTAKSRLKLMMASHDGTIKDAFDIQVLPKPANSMVDKLRRKIWLLDTRGITGAALSGMGVNYVPYRGEKLDSGDILVIGRESAEACVPFARVIRESAMAGANVLILEQTEKDLARHFGLRAFAASSRKLFTGAACAKMLPGFEDSDFIDWAGKATMLKECPKPYSESYPVHIWKRGNGGTVASVVIEKPHTGRFIPLLHEGFNLNYTPLMLDYCGKGSIIFCQLDLNGRSGTDPVAESLYRRILQLADSLTAPPCGRLVYSGGDAGRALLTHMEVNFKVSDTPGDAGLWIIGEGAKAMEAPGISQVRDFLEKGGKVVFLNHNSPAASAAKLGGKCSDWSMESFALPAVNMGDLTSGLTAADWYWKDKAGLKLPEEACPLKEFRIGKGCLLICQLNPMQFRKEEMNQRRFAARLKMFRCLSSVLGAKGASWTSSSMDSLSGVGQSVFDLTGEWNFRTDPEERGDRDGWAGTPWTGGFRHLNVPGSWESQGVTEANPHYKNPEMPYDGNAWYQHQLHLGKELTGKELYLEMGAVDDYDWTYFNGRLIGRTGRETPGWYAAKRLYKIPQDAVKFGATNLIAVKVMDDYMSGGIVSGPVRIFVKKDKEEFPYLEEPDYLGHDPYLFQRW